MEFGTYFSQVVKNLDLQKTLPTCTLSTCLDKGAKDMAMGEGMTNLGLLSKKFEKDHPGSKERLEREMEKLEKDPASKKLHFAEKIALIKAKGVVINDADVDPIERKYPKFRQLKETK